MEVLCKDLRNQAMKTINHEKKEMIPLTNEKKESYEKQEVYYIYIKKNLVLIENTVKSEIIVITQDNLEKPLIIIAI